MDATITIAGLLPGCAPVAKITRTAAAGLPPIEASLAAGKAGTLSTRTDNTDGTLTLGSGHGITDGQVISIFWTDANGNAQFAYGATVGTVSGTSVPFTGAAGTNLPAQATSIVACVETEYDWDVDGDKIEMLLVQSTQVVGVQFVTAADAVLDAAARAANEPYMFIDGVSQSNPLTGDPVDAVRVANGGTAQATVKLGGLYNADT